MFNSSSSQQINLIDDSKINYKDITNAENIIKQIQNLIEIEDMKINFMNQKIKQSKYIFIISLWILEKKTNDLLKYEIKKINSTNIRNKEQVNILQKENDFLQKMIIYTRKNRLNNQIN